jgi:hypothetical protein
VRYGRVRRDNKESDMALGQSAGPHTVWRGVDDQFYLSCPKKGIIRLPGGKETPFCPGCPHRLAALTNLIPLEGKEPERWIQEQDY